jgi:hypothetical protein
VTTPSTFDEIDPGVPRHHDEVMASHGGQPTVAEQDRTHGAGIPAVDNGESDQAKYSC